MSLKSTLDYIQQVLTITSTAVALVIVLKTQIHLEPPAPIVVALPLTTLQVIQK